MRNNCYIDGVSMWDKYGVWITKGGYNDLLLFPALKEPKINSWPEEDGIEVNLLNPVLSDKTISITFLASRRDKEVNDFIAFISTPGYHTLYIPSLKKEWSIRLLSHPDNIIYPGITSFTLDFAQDVIVRPDEVQATPGMFIIPSSYELDGVPLNQYGIVVDSGKNSLLQSPTVKTNLNRNILSLDGKIYDADHLAFNSKEVTFKCRFKASSIDNFWSCYNAFFAALIQPGERELYTEYTGEGYSCYYKDTSGFNIITLSNRFVMVEFNFTLVFTVFRINETEYLLSSEAGELVVTEDGEYCIDLKDYGN